MLANICQFNCHKQLLYKTSQAADMKLNFCTQFKWQRSKEFAKMMKKTFLNVLQLTWQQQMWNEVGGQGRAGGGTGIC